MNTDKYTAETLTRLRRWTDNLMSFSVTRAPEYRFVAGQFARLGLACPDPTATDPPQTRLVSRAYSIVSATSAPELEFCSVLVPDGEFTGALAQLAVGAVVYVEKTSYGFLTTERFAPGTDLWMMATGTGLAPFISMLHEPHHWREYQHLVVVHSVREPAELAYRDEILALADEPGLGRGQARLHYVPVVTRKPRPGDLSLRLPELLRSGQLEAAAGITLGAEHSRVLLCGNPAMVRDMRSELTPRGFASPRRNQPGSLAVENYW